jgi:hypothetical protein
MKTLFHILIWAQCMLFCKAQNIEIGTGKYFTNQTVFKSGASFHMAIGYRIPKHFMASLSFDYFSAPDIDKFYPRIIQYGPWGAPLINPDTFYNVSKKNKYTFFNILFNPRIYSSQMGNFQCYLSPLLGFSIMKESIQFSGDNYYSYAKYPSVFPAVGGEFGLEYSISKNGHIKLQLGISALFNHSNFTATDIYQPSFQYKNTVLNNNRIGIVWDFQKQ